MENAYEAIMHRRSIREFSDSDINEDDVDRILAAGMSGPTAVNARDWQFVTIRKDASKEKLASVMQRPAKIIRESNLLILVCGDLKRTMKKHPEFWIIDGSISAQNMIIAAQSMGIGSVWLGVWPKSDTMKAVKEVLEIPDTAVPHSLIAFGYPKDDYILAERNVFEPELVHQEKWSDENENQ